MNDQEWWQLLAATKNNLPLIKRTKVVTVQNKFFEQLVEAPLDRDFDDVVE